MVRVAVNAVIGALFCFATAALAQDIEVSSLDIKSSSTETKRQVTSESTTRHITDVKGRQVRLVGQRFFPDDLNEIALFGRAEALKREQARAQITSN